jgi:alpha-L-arabinofuranosidase
MKLLVNERAEDRLAPGDIMSRYSPIPIQWAKSRRVRPRLEALEGRALPSTVSWMSSTSGAWTTKADWSTGAVPGSGDDVVINQSPGVTVTLAASTSIHSLSLTGATLDVTGGTLAVAADSSNAGSLQVQPGAHVTFAGNYVQSAPGSLTLPAAGLGTGVGTNLLANTGFESPSTSTTAPSGWSSWGTSYLSTQYAHSESQSLQTSGSNSGVLESFAATPGVSYTGAVYAMTPATNPLTGPEGGYIEVIFYDASGNQISPYSPPNSVNILSSTSATGGPIAGSVGNQGWNSFSNTVVAPSNAASVDFILETGAYTGLPGTAGGVVFWDDPQFGPAAAGGGVASNLLSNTGFESPSVTTTAPTGWSNWGTSYLSAQYAHIGAQSLEASGPNSGVIQSFAVTPGVSYTGTVYAMTPAGNALTGPEGAFLQVIYYDAGGNQISSYTAPNSVEILNSTSATGGPITGSVGNQGWNEFSTTTVAPADAATVNFVLETGAYTGLPGTAGGAVFWDDPQFGPTAASAGTLSAVNITNYGIITVGTGDTVAASGTFTQTSSGTLDIQLGGPPASGLYGSLSSAGAATLAGTLEAALASGYSPAVTDGFNVVTYPSVTGAFATDQLPSGSSYSFAAAVNPNYVGLGAVPPQAATTINTGTVLGTVSTNMLGVNLAWWDDKLTTPLTQQMVEAAGLSTFRFPGGSSSDDYHFNVASNFNDSAANTIAQFAQFIQGVGGIGLVTLDYGSGSPKEAAAELAYLEGSPTDTTVIGMGLEWNDNTSQWQQVNWQTVGYWASLRAAMPLPQDDGYNFLRINHPSPFSNIKYWEVGNEEYGSWEIDHHGTPGPGGVSTGAQHDPATYAAFADTFAGFVVEIDPGISIGIDSGDPNGSSDNDWTKNVLTQGLALGFVPGFISDHSYMQAPGQESDSTLLLDTVSDPNSVLDWSTRYADYQSLLQEVLGGQAAGVTVMATEFNSVYSNPGKQSTSLVNGLFIADSIGSLLDSGYTGGFVWALRNSWETTDNNSPSLYGWRQGGDYGLLGDPNTSDPPSTGPYVPYPNYFAEQLASKIVQAGGHVVSASSNFRDLTAYAVMEANNQLELLVINKNPDANLNEQFTVQGFSPSGQAQVWQYGEAQDYAQSQTTDGSATLASFTTTVARSGSSFSYTFPAYSMTVLDLTPATVATLPTATLAGPSDGYHGVDGQTRTFTPGATDPSASAMQAGFTYTFNWGDGTSSNPDVQTIAATAGNGSGLTVSHVFPSAGMFTVSLTATDLSGNTSAPVTLAVNILAAEHQGNTLAVGGGLGNDAYTFTPGASSGTVAIADNGTSLGTFTSALVQVYGGGGSNTVAVSAAP